MNTVEITPRGPFSLAASGRFLEGFAPARYGGEGHVPDDTIRLAFPADDGRTTVSAAVRQAADGTVLADLTSDANLTADADADPASDPADAADPAAARAQLARIFSLDIDGSGFAQVAVADPVVADLAARYPGLRPVCFGSPFEAAAWAIIGHRIRITQAAVIKERIADRYGQRLAVAGTPLAAFPAPSALLAVERIPGLPEIKTERLRALAQAALAGDLDAAWLRATPPGDALAHLRTLPGIGPFSAELILIRGAAHPDLFPACEPRLHAAMAEAYHLDNPDLRQLAKLSAQWAPYRSWVAFLLRIHREETTHEIAQGKNRAETARNRQQPPETGV
jgi:DNA-3-methyladenine glycosylase II